MIINSIIIENFRCYYGKNQISFNSNGKITLIYGDSGYGKSSLLQFFRWMFYGDPDFGENNDKPLFNIAAFNNCGINEKVKVYGQVDFEHMGVSYSLHKCLTMSTAINPMNAVVESTDYELELDANDGKGYVPYNGDVASKINSILPKDLSKYFFLDGEKARETVLNSKELKQPIYSLFGLDAYKNAISHIGSADTKNSVLGKYAKKLAETLTQKVDGMTAVELQEAIQELSGKIEDRKAERKEVIDKINKLKNRSDELFKSLGAVTNKKTIESLIKANNTLIEQHEQKIRATQREIGDLFYKWYPYLFLSNIASDSSTILREQKSILSDNYKDVFENLKKDLLKEILEKKVCICGRELDEKSIARINGIINVMPPDSYVYQFGQFVSKAKSLISQATQEVSKYDDFIEEIALKEDEISNLEHQNQKSFDELKKIDDAKDLIDELEQIKEDIAALERIKSGLEGKIAQMKQIYAASQRKLDVVKKSEQVSELYSNRINFFEQLAKTLKEETRQMEAKVRTTLNECVRETFKKLTTQTEIDANAISFINEDFTLRTTYLTGGQLAVDVYSYVIGIVKALQEFKLDNNESPIIIDAPFAFTGTDQSEHLFKTLPTVSKQTILLTLDLNKIKNLLYDTEKYDFYVIKNETQEKAKIERGDISDIEF